MNTDYLTVAIPPPHCFYSLYADGVFSSKRYDENSGIAELTYNKDTVLFLYYTYPAHRRVYLVRNVSANDDKKISLAALPGLSKKVKIIFRQTASRVDKTKHAVSYLNERHGGAYGFPDVFYHRLNVLLSMRGKLSYRKIDALVRLGR
jgi:hypothetical protein